MINVLYLAYGGRLFRKAAAFSMLSFLGWADSLSAPWRIVVYTDHPGDFAKFKIPCVTHPLSDLRPPPAEPLFRFWPKLMAYEHCAAQHDGSIFFLDTDTYFLGRPDDVFGALSSGCSVMHAYEWPLAAPEDASFALDISDPPLTTSMFETDTMRHRATFDGMAMWNAGVVGVDESRVGLIADVIDVCEELLRHYSSHTLEQLAWSLVLQAESCVVPAEGVVCHYWHLDRLAIEYDIVHFLRRNAHCPLHVLAARSAGLAPASTYASRTPSLELRSRRGIRQARRLMNGARAEAGLRLRSRRSGPPF